MFYILPLSIVLGYQGTAFFGCFLLIGTFTAMSIIILISGFIYSSCSLRVDVNHVVDFMDNRVLGHLSDMHFLILCYKLSVILSCVSQLQIY